MKRYRPYGLDLASELALAHPVPELLSGPATGPPDLTFERISDGPLPGEDDPGIETIYRSTELRPDGEPVLSALSAGGAGPGRITLLRYAGEASFSVSERRIVGRAEAPGADGRALLELRLVGPVLAFWLERSGTPTLHASAVAVGERAVAFLAGKEGGKSSLAAAFLDAGHRLLTDDVLAVRVPRAGDTEFEALPASPQMRFRPEDAARRLGAARAAGLPRAHPWAEKVRLPVERFEPEPRPLARIHLLDRRVGGDRVTIEPVSIEPVRGREAVLALVAGSFLPRLVAAMGWGPRRLDLLARLASEVPIRRVSFPGGLERLPEVVDRLAEDAFKG